MAADLEIGLPAPKPVVYVSPYFNWEGIYIGAYAGGAWGSAHWPFNNVNTVTVGTTSSNTNAFTLVYPDARSSVSGFAGGGQLGMNFQSEAWVWGFTAAFTGMHVNGSVTDLLGEQDATSVNWSAEFSMRAGYTFEHLMLYGRVGAAVAQSSHTAGTNQINLPGVFTAFPGGPSPNTATFVGVTTGTATRFGYLLGTGVEYGIDRHWSVMAEYDYLSFGSQLVNFPGAGTSFAVVLPTAPPGKNVSLPAPSTQRNIDLNLQRFIVGVNYRFY